MDGWNYRGSLVGGVLAAIGASVCCVGPLVLLGLGVSGAWIGALTALEPIRPLLIGLTLLFLALAFRRLYLVAPACEPGAACAVAGLRRRQRAIFWIVTAAVALLLAAPLAAPLWF